MCKRYRGWTRDSASANLDQALILAGPATARWLNPWLRIGGPAQGLGGLSSSSKTARASLRWSRLPPLSGRSPIGRWRGCSGWRSAEPVDQRLRLGGDRRQFKVFHQGEEIPEAEVRLLITVTDDWLAQHNRFEVLDRLRWRLSQPRRPVDLLLFSRSQAEQRLQLHSSMVRQATIHGLRLDG